MTRKDGETYGFTDHDRDLSFDGHVFKAASGLSAGALQQTTGLSVDNSEAVGALSDASVREEDLAEGRFDGAEVQSWLVNWADISARVTEFRGNFGEVTRKAGAFRVELRGLSERLNQVQGLVYQAGCGAILGDARCGVNLGLPAYRASAPIAEIDVLGRIRIEGLTGFADQWFERGQIEVLSGASAGMSVMVKADRRTATGRVVDLWHGTGAVLGVFVASGLRGEVLMVLFGILGLIVGLYLGFGRSDWRLGDTMPTGLGRAITGPVVGFLSVLMGIGGGSFGVPLMSLYNVPIHRAVATAAGFGLVIAIPSVLAFLLIPASGGNPPPLTVGQVNLVGFVVVVAMTLITTPVGVRLAHALDAKRLKRIFALFVLVMALNMIRKAIWG